MAQEQDAAERTDGELRQFEKNRYFQGKLMTARDMQTEQAYHAGRLHAINRFVMGRGVIHGITVSAVEETDSDLEVTVEPGIALDGFGRPIVVEHTTTRPLPLPSNDEIYLYLRFAEEDLESVPVPRVRGAVDEETMSYRTVEGFELTFKESPPDDFDSVPGLDTAIPRDADGDEARRMIANRYHDQFRAAADRRTDPAILLGAFKRESDGTWTEGADSFRRHLVYDNELLYSALVNHITDTGNPHNVVGQPGDAGVDIELEELQQINRRLQTMGEQLDTLSRYVMRKSLKERIRFFRDVSARFEEHDTSGSRIAQEIVEEASIGMDEEVYDDPEAYRSHVGGTLELDLDLGEALEASATEDSLQRYVKAVNELQEVLGGEADVLRVAEAQDQVCEAADSLEVLYEIVPED